MPEQKQTSSSMPVLSTISGAAQAAGSLVNGVVNAARGKRWYEDLYNRQSKIQYEYQQKAAEEEYRRNKEFWNMQNEYNESQFLKYSTPAAQRRMLESAGLLGASLFDGAQVGSPQLAEGSTGTPSAPSISGQPGPVNFSGFMDVLDAKQKQANIENTKADTELKDEQSATQGVQRGVLESVARLNDVTAQLQSSQKELIEVRASLARIEEQIQSTYGATSAALDVDIKQKQSLNAGLDYKYNLTTFNDRVATVGAQLSNLRIKNSYEAKILQATWMQLCAQAILYGAQQRLVNAQTTTEGARFGSLVATSVFLNENARKVGIEADWLPAQIQSQLDLQYWQRMNSERDYHHKAVRLFLDGLESGQRFVLNSMEISEQGLKLFGGSKPIGFRK